MNTLLVATLAAPPLPTSMRAVTSTAVASGDGNFTMVHLLNRSVPTPGHGEILLAVHASSVNPVDWKILSGGLPLRFPHVLGFDASGIVAAVGSGCNRIKVGDSVWADLGKTWLLRGGELGAYADYALADESQVALKPQAMSFIDAASMPLVGLTTLQAFRMMGLDRPVANATVVVTSGSGGTGFVGIQMAKAYGASKVVAACGPTTQDFCKDLGADVVVDYTKGPHALWQAAGVDQVSYVYDNYGAPGTADLAMGSMRSGGVFLFLPGKGAAVSKHPKAGVKQINFGLCDSSNHEDLDELKALVDGGKLAARVTRTFPLEQTIDAFRESYAGKAIGKIGIYVTPRAVSMWPRDLDSRSWAKLA